MKYRLLDEFEKVFAGRKYRHRDSSNGDWVALHLSEDLYSLGRSQKFVHKVSSKLSVQNLANRRTGVAARRGDGTVGEIIPGSPILTVDGFNLARGNVATIEIGTEVKVLLKAMIKQIDRVIGDLNKQVTEFHSHGGHAITVGIVGINHAPFTIGYEGERAYRTGPRVGAHPIEEAAEAERRLMAKASSTFDEFLILKFIATNDEPFNFAWVDKGATEMEYGAALVRISKEFERRF